MEADQVHPLVGHLEPEDALVELPRLGGVVHREPRERRRVLEHRCLLGRFRCLCQRCRPPRAAKLIGAQLVWPDDHRRTPSPPESERGLLEAARGGDGDAYGRLVEARRGELLAHCYRMLGSVQDAEDALQEALLRGVAGPARLRRPQLPALVALPHRHQRLPRRHRRGAGAGAPGGARAGARPRARRRRLPVAESAFIEPFPDDALGVPDGLASPEARYERRESVELAFVAAMQHLPARQRAVLILRDVLAFSAKETSEALGTTVASANSALQRARAATRRRAARPQPAGRPAGPGRRRRARPGRALHRGPAARRRGRRRGPPDRGRDLVDAARAHLVLGGRRCAGFLSGPAPVGALASRPDARERPARGGLLCLGRDDGRLRRLGARRAHPARRAASRRWTASRPPTASAGSWPTGRRYTPSAIFGRFGLPERLPGDDR